MAAIRRRRAATERLLARMKGRPRLATTEHTRAVRPSAAVQARYRKRLQQSNTAYKKQVDKAASKLLAEIEALDRSKPDAFAKQVQRIEKRIGGLQRNLTAANKRSIRAVDQFVNESEAENKRRTIQAFGKRTDPAVIEHILKEKQDIVERQNARLREVFTASITSANREYSDRVQRALYDKLANPGADAKKKIRRAKGIVTRRIKNTVQSQGHELNAGMNRTRQRALGAKKYMWQTKEDERVRHEHADNNRIVFSWSKRPDLTGHPGEDHNCRCSAVPVFDDIAVGTRL